jgi:DNA-binding GntR family transcriptional regulator
MKDPAKGSVIPADGQPRATTSKLELAYAAIKQRIIDGTYTPGYRLVLDQIARELSVSPVPIREAVRRLEAEGYVEFERNVGARVAHLDPEEYVPTMHVLALLEGYATVLAAPHLRAEDLAAARSINERMRTALTNFDPLSFTTLNREFHFVIYARCPNQHLRTLLEAEWQRLDAIRRSTFVYAPGRAEVSVAEHDALLALLAGAAEPGTVELAARDHKLHTLDALVSTREAGHRPAAARAIGEPTIGQPTIGQPGDHPGGGT